MNDQNLGTMFELVDKLSKKSQMVLDILDDGFEKKKKTGSGTQKKLNLITL
jgi:hypothetical protein